MKLIYIEWEDAIAQTGWHTEKEIQEWSDKDNTIIKEVGWIYKESKRYLVLISRKTEESMGDDPKYITYGLLQKIPKTWIKKRIDLTKHIK